MDDTIDWQTRPTILQYFGTYVTVALVLYVLYRLQYLFSYHPLALMMYTNWTRPLDYWSSSDWPIFTIAAFYLLGAFLLLMVAAKILSSLFTRYLLMKDQLIINRYYVLGSIQHRVELYRIIDYTLAQTFWGGLFNYYTVVLRTTDANASIIRLGGLYKGYDIMNRIRDQVEEVRMKKGVREFTSGVPGWGG